MKAEWLGIRQTCLDDEETTILMVAMAKPLIRLATPTLPSGMGGTHSNAAAVAATTFCGLSRIKRSSAR